MQHLYSIQDAAHEAFGPIIAARAQGEAVRMFMDEATDANSRINKHPADYTLYKIGTFDEQTGVLVGQTPEKISTATDYTEK